uniref:THAP domain-containing protein 1-like n=1 Tax=Myxine glutinosa TaxID=7769 RepID=UPI00358FF09D
MPKRCACYGCTNRTNQKKDVRFHRFPLENPQLLSKWLTNISTDNFHPTENHRVCSEHFVVKDYLQEKRNPAEDFSDDHRYSASPDIIEQELRQTEHKLQEARKELKGLKQKLRRRNNTILKLLETVKEQNMMNRHDEHEQNKGSLTSYI